ncbi:hypothetical protein ES703_29000 [subsurface metagenome]
MDEKIKIQGDTVTISAPDRGQIVLDLNDLLEFQAAIQAITNLYTVGDFQTLEFTLTRHPPMGH